jgi:hypothetical protein
MPEHSGPEEPNAGELVFNALIWKNGLRLFGALRDLCNVMLYNKKTNELK